MTKSWMQSTLGELCKDYGGKIQTGPFGSQLHQSDYVDGGIPVVMPKDINQQGIDLTSVAKISLETAARLSRHKLHKDEIVFPRRGEITKCALIKQEQEGFLCGTGCLKITVPQKILNPLFFRYYLAKNEIIEWLDSNAVGATMKNLSTGILEKLPVLFPTLQTQQKIAAILSAYDDLIENNLKRIKLLEEMAQITYEEWFVRLRFPGYESTPINSVTGLPEGWRHMKCSDAMEVLSGGTPKTGVSEYWNGKIPFYTPKDAVECSYVFETEKYVTDLGVSKCNSKLYPKNTVFITARGTVGKVNLAGCPMAMNQSCYALQGKLDITQYFLFFLVKASIDGFKGAANGGVFNTIVVDTFRFMRCTLPTQDLIFKFNDFVSPILCEVSNLIRQNSLLKEARDILLPRLMTGKIDVESYNPADLLKEVA